MRVSETASRRVAALLVAAIVTLVARVIALQFGASRLLDRGLYGLALAILAACVIVILLDAR